MVIKLFHVHDHFSIDQYHNVYFHYVQIPNQHDSNIDIGVMLCFTLL